MAAHNHERFVQRSLDSILADEYPNKELVIIDDGSTDGTLAAIERWVAVHGSEIAVSVTSRPNRGIGRTLNELLRAAHGEYVVAVASDDYLLPGGLSGLVVALEASDCQAVFGDAQVVDEVGNLRYDSALFEYHKANRERLTTNLAHELIFNWAAGCTVTVCRRESILAMGGYIEDTIAEDWDFYLRLAARGWLRFVDHKATAYRLHGSNTHRDPQTVPILIEQHVKILRRVASDFHGRTRWLLLAKLAYNSPVVVRLGGKRLLGKAARIIRQRALSG
jgi:glycosyltransferase involved in cell wall biosynthesis